jgi:ribosome-binding factor A
VRLKHTPTLTFDYDDSIDTGMRISQLIDQEVPRDDR